MRSPPDAARTGPLLTALLAALACLSLTAYLDLAFLEGIHEARVLETAREMLELGNWVVPHFNGELRLEKPPLPYWASALAYLIAGGPSVAAARLVAALLGLLMLASAWGIARAVADRRTALLVVPVMAGLMLFNTEFRKVTTDPFLAAFSTAAVACFAWAFRRSGRPGLAWLLSGYAMAALALLAKGPIALAFTGIGALFVRPGGDATIRHPWPRHVLGAVIASAPVLAWAVMVMLNLPNAFDTWRHEILGRVTGDVEEMRSRWFYLPALLMAGSPLLLPFLAGLARGLFQRDRMTLWFLAGIAFLMLLSSRKAAYLLPLMAPAALAAAQYLARIEAYREGRWLMWGQLIANLLLIAGLLGAALAWRSHLNWGAVVLGLLLLAALAGLLRGAFASRPSPLVLAVSGVLITTFYDGVLLTHLPEDRTVQHLAAWIEGRMPPQSNFYQQGDIDPRLSFDMNRLPRTIEDSQLDSVPAPAWLLRREPLPPALPGWQLELKSHSRKGKTLYLYRRD